MKRRATHLVLVWLCVAAVLPAQVISPKSPESSVAKPSAAMQSTASKIALKADMEVFGRLAEETLSAASKEIQTQSKDRKIRSAASAWESRMKGLYADALKKDDPVAALADAWAASHQQSEFLHGGEGRDLFGPQQGLAQSAADQLLEEIRHIAANYFPKDSYGEVESHIEEYGRSNPLARNVSTFERVFDINKNLFSVVDIGKSTLSAIASVPLLPNRAVSGIRQGTENLGEFNRAVERFSDVAQAFPKDAREQLEAMLTKFEDNNTTLKATLDNLREITANIRESVVHGDSLTSNVSQTIVTARDSTEAFKAATESVRQAAQEGTRLADSITDLVETLRSDDSVSSGSARTGNGKHSFDPKEYETAANALRDSASEIRTMLEEIRKLTEDGRENSKNHDPEHHSFDVREYDKAAQSLQASAAEIRGVLGDIRNLSGDKDLSEGLAKLKESADASIEKSQSATIKVTDHFAWRAAQLIAFAFALGVVYQAVKRKMGAGDRNPKKED